MVFEHIVRYGLHVLETVLEQTSPVDLDEDRFALHPPSVLGALHCFLLDTVAFKKGVTRNLVFIQISKLHK